HMVEMRVTYLAESALSFKAHFCSAPESIYIWFQAAPNGSKPLWEAERSQFESVDAFISEVSSFVHDLLTGRVSVTTYSARNVVFKWVAYRGTDRIQS
ncbi:MAG TPA: hypothetical protein PLI64_14645, partial [Phycisphaerae bacterium]|nr:hypothetical protein [Phycisphaerae bacterium]